MYTYVYIYIYIYIRCSDEYIHVCMFTHACMHACIHVNTLIPHAQTVMIALMTLHNRRKQILTVSFQGAFSGMYIDTHIHTYIHTCIHVNKQVLAVSCQGTFSSIYMHTNLHTHTWTYIHRSSLYHAEALSPAKSGIRMSS